MCDVLIEKGSNIKKVLFVCDGNTCRSPMAEVLFNRMVKEKGLFDYVGLSAGISTHEGMPMNELAQKALCSLGCETPNDFVSKQITPTMLQEAYIVLCMTEYHKCLLFGYKNVEKLADDDVSDPYGGKAEEYYETAVIIQKKLESIIERFKCKDGLFYKI